jgi:hypothetical protein
MAFDLTTAKTRLAITGTAQDAEIQGALAAALALAETYCDRWFMFAAGTTEKFIHQRGPAISLKRYPIVAVHSLTPTNGTALTASQYHIDADAGLIVFHGGVALDEVTVNFDGGYVNLPADLEMALFAILSALWSRFDATQFGSGGGVSTGVGPKQVRAGDLSITYFDPGTQAALGGGALDSLVGADTLAILDLYRKERC